ncbi:sterol desaturase family protein [Pigmentiphaga sp. GD03639]|uniref:sterol desaturase family protein n=1 Tax=unclassified Pigmentiphaga TaxID=2626614 RepID=UPI000B40A498|nr:MULTISPECIES: sterol desaturase family protein [unclassified Pigmentiphaga]MDH2235464.1 sterol desaturase family protein [Pigmentiphaga sp. GD03639]OVZ61526.1 fatty acid hydroxylase [Pigmentiphaga sp. NML030171]
MSYLASLWTQLIAWVSTHLVEPAVLFLHIADTAGNPLEISEALLIALLQLFIIGFIFRPLETLAPAERWEDRKLTRIDRLYTLLMLLGLFPLFSYLVLTPFANMLGGLGGEAEAGPAVSSGLKHWVPWFEDHPYLLFLVYYLVYDCVYYWMHRAQHAIPWWWALHSMHHSQRQMSCWTNDRGSYIDGVLQSFILATVGLAMGVEPSEFALLGLLSELVQNLSHTNVRFGFGRIGERLLVDPKFHRLHHMVRDPERPSLHNCNFGQVLPVWDILFGTALYGEKIRPTGVSDPMVDADNDRGLVGQQWQAARRFWGAVRRPAGWRLGEVSFGPDYAPIPSDEAEHLPVPADAGPAGGAPAA